MLDRNDERSLECAEKRYLIEISQYCDPHVLIMCWVNKVDEWKDRENYVKNKSLQ